ncbi:reverse transcriptase domain-containing protein [Tanacetum coccineum]
MTGLPRTFKLGSEIFVTEHKLNEDKKITPVQQMKRGMAPERSAATSKEVEELRKAGILRETRYQTWVSNTVMVKRQTEHGEYAYKGYHQIQMAREDEHKTGFHDPKGVYYFRKMPFGLKNAGATYQRLADKVFKIQISRNIEAYVDDMVIKSMDEEDRLADIQETFKRLQKINMKLSPKKFSFGMEEGDCVVVWL